MSNDMSGVSGSGGGNPAFDNLLTLAQFVQTPEFVDRVKELRDLELSSKESFDASAKAAQTLAESLAAHELDKQSHRVSVAKLIEERDAFALRKAKIEKAMSELTKAMRE